MNRIPPHLKRAAQRFGEDVATWRRLQRLTAEDVARRAGISRSTLHRLEKGELGVSFGTVLSVASALNQLDVLSSALDPMKTDLGQLRMREGIPERVRR